MVPRRFTAVALSVALSLAAAAQPSAQEPAALAPAAGKKRAVAVFGLGDGSYAVPPEALERADASILGAFSDLGRFTVMVRAERLSASELKAFIAAIKESKRRGKPLSVGLKFGEVELTEELMGELYGASVVVIPTITDFRSGYNDARAQFEATVKTAVSFLDVAAGTVLAKVNLVTSGSSKETERKSVQGAFEDISARLRSELRDISVFSAGTQVIRIADGRAELRLGSDAGVKVGDEYAVITTVRSKGGVREEEGGLILIEQVGPELSTGTILYGESKAAEGGRLREVPRLGLDVAPYGRYLRYFRETNGMDGAWVAGVKLIPTRGFYSFKPLIGFQVNTDWYLRCPITGYLGVQYDRYLRRLTVGANAALGGSSNLPFAALRDEVEDASLLSHWGFLANAGAGFLVLRDLRLFAEVGAEYWFSLRGDDSGPAARYGGIGLTVGAAIKL